MRALIAATVPYRLMQMHVAPHGRLGEVAAVKRRR